MKLEIDGIGGLCPVQATGYLGDDKYPFYFRARGDGWSFDVWPANPQEWEKSSDLPQAPVIYCEEHPYGVWPEAGYMPTEEAEEFIKEAAERFADFIKKEGKAPP